MFRSFVDAVLTGTEKIFPLSTAAKLRHTLSGRTYFYPFGTAMNGQTARLEMTRQILYRCGIQQIVETGTYRGTTTEWFAGFKLPIVTVEANPSSFHFAKHRLARWPNVRLELDSSESFLKALPGTVNTSLPTLFYLDAHWAEYLPLRDELKSILANFAAPVVLVDDFRVPSQPAYQYDDYGPGKVLEIEYLTEFLTGGMKAFFPSTPGEQETGRKRGCIVLTPNSEIAAQLAKMDLLREEVR